MTLLDWLELTNKILCNILRSRSDSPPFLEENYLDENISITLLMLASKIQDFQVYQYHNILFLSPNSEWAQYKKD